MLHKMTVRNFKHFEEAEIELGNPVVFIGPNNSGKSTALQALTLWEAGMKKWTDKRKGQKTPEKRPGVSINYKDLISIPVPNAKLLWKNLHVVDSSKDQAGKPKNEKIYVEIVLEGVTGNSKWKCGFEFYYANEESFYCRPKRLDSKGEKRMPVPAEAENIHIALLPPMSGLTTIEDKLTAGSINRLIGEGRTAEVLRNLCYKISQENKSDWDKLVEYIIKLFGVKLEAPKFSSTTGIITMGYSENNIHLDISCSGRGLQQTLLILSFMFANPDTVLLLDEPDAHLELLRQEQIYDVIIDVANKKNNQIIAASHSEKLLNVAVGRDVVVAFVGKPHRVNRGSQVIKALKDIGFDHYYLAEQTGWILYLEGSTDLAILKSFAAKLNHEKAMRALERPFVHYVGNQPRQAQEHFYGIREAKKDLVGIAIFDRLEKKLPPSEEELIFAEWQKNEIENYLCQKETLLNYVRNKVVGSSGDLFDTPDSTREWPERMEESINEISTSLKDLKGLSPWSDDVKASDDFLEPLFRKFYDKLDLPNEMDKKNFHVLAEFVPEKLIDDEVREKLDLIVEVAEKAQPVK